MAEYRNVIAVGSPIPGTGIISGYTATKGPAVLKYARLSFGLAAQGTIRLELVRAAKILVMEEFTGPAMFKQAFHECLEQGDQVRWACGSNAAGNIDHASLSIEEHGHD